MYLKNIKLTNFRNYQDQQIQYINGINLFLGPNAQGKTNIIEAIYLAAFGTSYRTLKDSEVINFNNDFAKIDVEYFDQYDQSIQIYIDKYDKKQIKENDIVIKKISDHVGKLLIVIFSPDSLDIIKGAPVKRRKFLDEICIQLSKKYLYDLNEYNKCLKIKNMILKNDQEKIDRSYIDILHQKMSENIQNIVSYRKNIVELLQQKAKTIHQSITNSKENLDIIYSSDFINLEKDKIKDILDSVFKYEIYRKVSLKGIQKDNLDFFINQKQVSTYGSQGQKRTVLLTLKLADFEVLKSEKNKTPILLLDDIMSELDQTRANYLLDYIKSYQSIITTTDIYFDISNKNVEIQKVLNGKLET